MLDLSMKNLLARGGIEFLAVFIGIVLSLWVDDWRGDRELRHRLEEDYKKIHIEVKADIVNIDSLEHLFIFSVCGILSLHTICVI